LLLLFSISATISKLGCFPLTFFYYLKPIRYWLRLTEMPNTRMHSVFYKCQYIWAESGCECWALHVKNLLIRHGFGYAWYNQSVGNKALFLQKIHQTLKDVSLQNWTSELRESNRLSNYNLIKSHFGLEPYLNQSRQYHHRSLLIRFRGGLLPLMCNSGVYQSVPWEQRICPLCNLGIETEYHFLLICPKLSIVRTTFLPRYLYVYPSEIKYRSFVSSSNYALCSSLAKYIECALRFRENCCS